MSGDRRIKRQHKRAYFYMGSLSKWAQHKATCAFCGGTPIIVAPLPAKGEVEK